MSKLSSLPRMSREDLPGAPEWVDQLLQVSNEFQEQATQRINQNLLTGVFEEYKFKHGVEQVIKNPFGNRLPIGISNVACQGLEVDSTGKTTGKLYDLEVSSIKWRPIQTRPGQPQRIGVTVKYGFSNELLTMRNSADQVVASGDQTIVYTTTEVQVGSGITYASGVFTVARGGIYQINVSYHYNGDGAAYGDVRTSISATSQDYWSIGHVAAATTDRIPQQLSHAFSLSASNTVSIKTNHGAVGNRTIGATGGDTRFQSRVSIARLSADTTATGRVTLRFDGGK